MGLCHHAVARPPAFCFQAVPSWFLGFLLLLGERDDNTYTTYPGGVIPNKSDVTKVGEKIGYLPEHKACTQLSKCWPSHLSKHLGLGAQARPTHTVTLCTRARKERTEGRAAGNFLYHPLWLRFPKHFHYLWGGILPQPALHPPSQAAHGISALTLQGFKAPRAPKGEESPAASQWHHSSRPLGTSQGPAWRWVLSGTPGTQWTPVHLSTELLMSH